MASLTCFVILVVSFLGVIQAKTIGEVQLCMQNASKKCRSDCFSVIASDKRPEFERCFEHMPKHPPSSEQAMKECLQSNGQNDSSKCSNWAELAMQQQMQQQQQQQGGPPQQRNQPNMQAMPEPPPPFKFFACEAMCNDKASTSCQTGCEAVSAAVKGTYERCFQQLRQTAPVRDPEFEDGQTNFNRCIMETFGGHQ